MDRDYDMEPPSRPTPGLTVLAFVTRRALPSDADAIALAHCESIRSIGPRFYPPDLVGAWQEGLTGRIYVDAMARGKVFFVASEAGDDGVVLGFSSDYVIRGSTHGTSVYVRGSAARRGIGSSLIRAAEAHAIDTGATRVDIEASLAGVEFYRNNGYVELGRGTTRLTSGRPIDCVFMRKDLVPAPDTSVVSHDTR